jgi:hypothetical protein
MDPEINPRLILQPAYRLTPMNNFSNKAILTEGNTRGIVKNLPDSPAPIIPPIGPTSSPDSAQLSLVEDLAYAYGSLQAVIEEAIKLCDGTEPAIIKNFLQAKLFQTETRLTERHPTLK